jgi:TrmH family RNA methyltransferase
LYVSEGVFLEIPSEKRTIVTENDLKKITCLSSPNNCLALFQIPTQKNQEISGLTIVLDDIRDPGNMGTIIRLCDWYGVNNIICSDQTVDIYNPKVVQATMGSIARVNVYYENLNTFLPTLDLPIYGTFMDGKNVYKEILPKNAILVLGNEANGISTEIEKLTTNKIAIPKFGSIKKAESLNVAMATAIFLSEFKRSAIEK